MKNKFSQIFLKDINIINTIIKKIDPKSNQAFVEIGPGLGALTKKIIHYVNFITLIEIDFHLYKILIKQLPNNKKINFIVKNVLDVNFKKLFYTSNIPLRIFGNLPYKISTKIILFLIKNRKFILDIHFMLQKEVAERCLAKPGNKKYNSFSILVQFYFKFTHLLNVSNSSFYPIPKVQSSFIKMVPYKYPLYHVYDKDNFFLLIKIAFSHKRKKIKNNLKILFSDYELIKCGINLNLRPEDLTIKQYCDLSNYLKKKNSGFNSFL